MNHSPYAVEGFGEATPPQNLPFPCGRGCASATREKKGAWRAFALQTSHIRHLRKVSYSTVRLSSSRETHIMPPTTNPISQSLFIVPQVP